MEHMAGKIAISKEYTGSEDGEGGSRKGSLGTQWGKHREGAREHWNLFI